MRKTLKCPNCGNPYSVRLLKVYVFKRRYCSVDKKPMFSDNERKIHKCKKCGLEVKFDDERKLAEMGVRILGSSRDSKKTRVAKMAGVEVVKKLIPKHQVCQRCRNFRRMIEDRVARSKKISKSEVRELSNVEVLEYFHKNVQYQMRKELQEKQQEEAERLQIEKAKKALKQGKEEGKPAMLTTPFNVVKKVEKKNAKRKKVSTKK